MPMQDSFSPGRAHGMVGGQLENVPQGGQHLKKNCVLMSVLVLTTCVSLTMAAGELVRTVRNKLSAGDLASGAAAVEEYKRKNGVDAEYLDAVGWLARGAEMLRR